jgi:hypothetical protein
VVAFRDYLTVVWVNEFPLSCSWSWRWFYRGSVGIPEKLEIEFFWPVGPLWVAQDATRTFYFNETVWVQIFRVFIEVVRVESIVYVIELMTLPLMLFLRSYF